MVMCRTALRLVGDALRETGRRNEGETCVTAIGGALGGAAQDPATKVALASEHGAQTRVKSFVSTTLAAKSKIQTVLKMFAIAHDLLVAIMNSD